MVVNKPAGLLVQGDDTGDTDLLTIGKEFLKKKFDKPGKVFLGLVHRLDRPVSGVVALARTSKAASRLSEQFREREPDKRYIALVEGRLMGEGVQEDYLATRRRTTEVVRESHPEARHAVLRWRALGTDRVKKGDVSLVEIELVTGRAHQIRAQMAEMKYPILGDLRYGASRVFDGRNLALHSYALTVAHPTKKEEMTFRAAPPITWRGYFDGLIKEAIRPTS